MDAISSGDESDAEPMSTIMLEDIYDGSQSHPIINIKRVQAKWKGALLPMQNIDKVLQKLFKAVVNNILQALPILGESGSECSCSLQNL